MNYSAKFGVNPETLWETDRKIKGQEKGKNVRISFEVSLVNANVRDAEMAGPIRGQEIASTNNWHPFSATFQTIEGIPTRFTEAGASSGLSRTNREVMTTVQGVIGFKDSRILLSF